MYDQKQQMIDALVKQLRENGVVWPSVSDVLYGKAPALPPKWHWRTRAGVSQPYVYYEQSDIIVVHARYNPTGV